MPWCSSGSRARSAYPECRADGGATVQRYPLMRLTNWPKLRLNPDLAEARRNVGYQQVVCN
jgi:hypothetical protein